MKLIDVRELGEMTLEIMNGYENRKVYKNDEAF